MGCAYLTASRGLFGRGKILSVCSTVCHVDVEPELSLVASLGTVDACSASIEVDMCPVVGCCMASPTDEAYCPNKV